MTHPAIYMKSSLASLLPEVPNPLSRVPGGNQAFVTQVNFLQHLSMYVNSGRILLQVLYIIKKAQVAGIDNVVCVQEKDVHKINK